VQVRILLPVQNRCRGKKILRGSSVRIRSTLSVVAQRVEQRPCRLCFFRLLLCFALRLNSTEEDHPYKVIGAGSNPAAATKGAVKKRCFVVHGERCVHHAKLAGSNPADKHDLFLNVALSGLFV
jgi:hypothetical protein